MTFPHGCWCSTSRSTVRRQRHGCAPQPPAKTPRSSKRQPTNWAHTVPYRVHGRDLHHRSTRFPGGALHEGSPTSVRADIDEAGLIVVEQVLSVANQVTLWRYDTATCAAHLGLPDQGASTKWRYAGAVGAAPRPVPARRHPTPRRGSAQRAPAGPDRRQAGKLQRSSDFTSGHAYSLAAALPGLARQPRPVLPWSRAGAASMVRLAARVPLALIHHGGPVVGQRPGSCISNRLKYHEMSLLLSRCFPVYCASCLILRDHHFLGGVAKGAATVLTARAEPLALQPARLAHYLGVGLAK
jgi:hypothetical protein